MVLEVAKDWFPFLDNQKQYVRINGSSLSIKLISTGMPQRFVGSLLFLVCLNDLYKCVKYSEIYHFTDYTNRLQSSSPFNKFPLPLMLLKQNQLFSTQVPKKLIISLKCKLNWKKITQTDTVKYLGVLLLDDHLL